MHAAATLKLTEQFIHYGLEYWACHKSEFFVSHLLGGPAVIADRVLKPFSNGITREYMNDICTMLCANVDCGWGEEKRCKIFPFIEICLLSILHSKELATH